MQLWNSKATIEFHQSEYVFEGKAIKKVYATDSLTYTITFEISTHYKETDNPKFLEFKLISESDITRKYSSCDLNVEVKENWLVYAKNKDGELDFQYHCSNWWKKNISHRTKSSG